ncbi:MAG: PQQ-like beta-propeller repeat protein [Dehalococcoidia bacterium]|nr:PQQ-like beta-propeller repeat protein [Dehalococcoidia bacterium]
MVKLSFISVKLSKALLVLLPLAVLSLAALSCVAPASGGGCAGPGAQGWSGFANYDGILYLGSMNGEVLALNPSARSERLIFPSERDGEWVLRIKAPAPSGGMCGPLGCAPAARPVAIYGTPAVAADLVCVATYVGDGGKVMAINRSAPGYDEEGNPSWKKQGEWVYPRGQDSFIGAIVGSPVVLEDTLYVGSSDGKVYALDAVYGDKRWEFDTGGKIWTSPAVEDGVVYISNYEGRLYALSGQDGSLLWEIELPAAIASSPVVSGDTVFFGTFDHYLYAVDSDDGKEKWRFEGGNWFWATPVVKDNVVYAGCLDHSIYALEASTGRELWQFVADSPIVSTPVLLDSLLVAISDSGEMYVLRADSGVSERTVSIGYSVMAPLYAEEDMVYVHARDGGVYCIDVETGVIAWEFSSVVD